MKQLLITSICVLVIHHCYAAETELKIALLKDHTDLIEKAAQLWWSGQGGNQKNFNQEQTKPMADYLRQHAHDQTKKYCWLALHGNEVAGIVQLVDVWTEDPQVAPKISAHVKEWTPWIRSLVVAQNYRKQGISKQLLKVAEQKARELNHEFTYVGVEHQLEHMYSKHGYETFNEDTFRGSPILLMRKQLR